MATAFTALRSGLYFRPGHFDIAKAVKVKSGWNSSSPFPERIKWSVAFAVRRFSTYRVPSGFSTSANAAERLYRQRLALAEGRRPPGFGESRKCTHPAWGS